MAEVVTNQAPPPPKPTVSNPKQLQPKAVWLFFFHYLVITSFLFFILFFWGLSLLITAIPAAFLNTDLSIGMLLGGLALVIGPLAFVYILAKLAYKNWRYELRNDALRVEKGIIWKRYVSIPYERIQNVDILRGLLARLLGLSDLHIQTAGASSSSGFSALFSSEGRLPGLSISDAESIRDELIKRAKGKQGV